MQELIDLSLQNEEWLPINYYPGYFISNYGRVYSIKTKKILAINFNNSDYIRVTLCNKGVRKHRFIHLLVVEHFGDCNGDKLTLELCPDGKLRTSGLSVDHLNRNKYDNSQSNLEIVTHCENSKRWRYVPKIEDSLPF